MMNMLFKKEEKRKEGKSKDKEKGEEGIIVVDNLIEK